MPGIVLICTLTRAPFLSDGSHPGASLDWLYSDFYFLQLISLISSSSLDKDLLISGIMLEWKPADSGAFMAQDSE